jgi:hypothetical protein
MYLGLSEHYHDCIALLSIAFVNDRHMLGSLTFTTDSHKSTADCHTREKTTGTLGNHTSS